MSQTVSTIEPVVEKRLELGRKVFKVPTQSKRRSSRIQPPDGKCFKNRKKCAPIMHHLLLAPTLKRQRKKKLDRERQIHQQSSKAAREWTWDFDSKSHEDVKLSDIFVKKFGSFSKPKRSFNKIAKFNLSYADVNLVRKKRKTDLDDIRRIARCGGVKCISGMDIYCGEQRQNEQGSYVPPPFEAKDSDPYILPEPGQLISYIWYTRPSPVLGEKQIYRTGVLCAKDGTIRFFEDESEFVSKNDEHRKFYEGRFYLNKTLFRKGNFRVRSDLVVGAVCYEREKKFSCQIIEIDVTSGAVLVKRINSKESCKGRSIWISPDDLVGHCKLSKIINNKVGVNMKNPINSNPNDVLSNKPSQTRTAKKSAHASSNHVAIAKHVATVRETIDLTQDDDCESDLSILQPIIALQKSDDFQCRPKTGFQPEAMVQSLIDNTPAQSSLGVRLNQWKPHDSIVQKSGIISSTKTQIRLDKERNAASSTTDVCKSFSVRDVGSQLPRDTEFPNWIKSQSSFLQEQYASIRHYEEKFRAMDNLNTTTTMTSSGLADSAFEVPTLANRFSVIGSSSSTLLLGGNPIRLELDLLKQHEMALDVLVSTTDLGTILATLQFIKRMQKRGIPVRPTAAKVVSAAEMTCRIQMEGKFLRYMTAPISSGGKGYNASYAGIILCRLAPILGPTLGRLDFPPVTSTKLQSLGLERDEIFDILPYIQTLEDDVLMKTISFKRQLIDVYRIV